jgi:hypothetical protein
MTSEKTNTEQRRATQNNARTRRSATQRATRRPEQSNLLPHAEPIHHGQTLQLHHTARPGRPHWPSDLAASHSDGPTGAHPTGPDTLGSAESSASPAAHKDADKRIGLHGRLDHPPNLGSGHFAPNSAGKLSALPADSVHVGKAKWIGAAARRVTGSGRSMVTGHRPVAVGGRKQRAASGGWCDVGGGSVPSTPS